MAITISTTSHRKVTSFQSLETMTQSTATSHRALNVHIDVSVLGMGTATGFGVNLYSLATTNCVEGQEKLIISHATGEAKVVVAGPTEGRLPLHVAFQNNPTATTVDALLASATGAWVFNVDGDFLLLKFMNGTWHYQDSFGVTQATAT